MQECAIYNSNVSSVAGLQSRLGRIWSAKGNARVIICTSSDVCCRNILESIPNVNIVCRKEKLCHILNMIYCPVIENNTVLLEQFLYIATDILNGISHIETFTSYTILHHINLNETTRIASDMRSHLNFCNAYHVYHSCNFGLTLYASNQTAPL